MNIDEILAKHGIISYPNKQYAKQAIKEVVTDVIQMCADNAELETRNYSKFGGKYTSENIGQEVNIDDMNNYIGIDKDSILKTINEINF